MSVGPKTSLVISTKASVVDGMGGYTDTWTSGKTVTGVFSILSDRERMMYGKKAEFASYKFILDYIFASAIDTMDRFVLGTRVFEIVSREKPMNQDRFVIFLLEENVNG